jgi:hypothetical protein
MSSARPNEEAANLDRREHDKHAEHLRMVEGSLKHEGIYLNDDERALILRSLRGELSDEQFAQEARALVGIKGGAGTGDPPAK